jgi:transposase
MSSTSTGGPALLGDDERTDLRRRWRQVEELFVDDPKRAVQSADDLITDVIDHIRASLDRRRAAAVEHGPDLDDATTEQLRAALQRYERLFEQLSDAPAPTAWNDQPD